MNLAERPVVQINLPAMPDPKDFRISSNATTNCGLWQLALNAWEKVSLASAQTIADSLASDREAPRAAIDHPHGTSPGDPDLTKN